MTITRDESAISTGQHSGTVLVVDDDPAVRRSVSRLLRQAGYEVRQAATASKARAAMRTCNVEVIVLDIGLPDTNGIDLLRELNQKSSGADVVMLTGSNVKTDMEESISCGAISYLRKPFDPLVLEAQVVAAQHAFETRRAAALRCSSLEGSLHDAESLLHVLPRKLAQRLCSAWDLRHVETGAHVRRIAEYSEVLSLTLGLSPEEATTIGQVAMLHDIGKIAIPDAILAKPGKLTAEEFEIMKRHPAAGAAMLGGSGHPFLERAAIVALRHHERWDGSGYPGHLRAEECPYDARIVAVADVYDALGQPRCYKPSWSETEIEAYFQKSSGTLFEPKIVDALLSSLPRLHEIAARLPDPKPEQAYESGVVRRAAPVCEDTPLPNLVGGVG